jgi:hypothetical protein
VASCAKNHRFRADPDPGPKPGVAAEFAAGFRDDQDDRRAERDRRDPSRAAPRRAHGGLDRRQGPRRAVELPSSIWRQPLALAVAIGLGIAAGLAVNWFSGPQVADPERSQPAPAQIEAARVDPDALARVQALRDEAEALTAAQVELDETAHERWMPRVARIEQALEDPSTPALLRDELDATITALECVGVLGDPPLPDLCDTRPVNRIINPGSPS